MTINFNNLRKQALYAYDSLTEKLNCSFLKEQEHVYEKDEDGKERCINGDMLLNRSDIQKDMDDLRSLLGTIASVYEQNDENFKDVYSEVYPKEETGMVLFNNEEE